MNLPCLGAPQLLGRVQLGPVPSMPMAVMTYQALAEEIRSRPAPVLPRLVAVDGPSGAGKTTFARNLASALGAAAVVEIDDFVSWGDFAGWWPRLEQQVLGPLLGGGNAVYQQRDWSGDPLGDGLGACVDATGGHLLRRRSLPEPSRSPRRWCTGGPAVALP